MARKDVPDNKTGRPLEHYRAKYAAASPEGVAARCEIPFDARTSSFAFSLLGRPMRAAWPVFALAPDSAAPCPPALCGASAQILVLRYLLEGSSAPSGGRFLSYRELPWGEVYDANFQGRCVRRLVRAFGSRLGDFARAAQRLGGTRLGPARDSGGPDEDGGEEAWEVAFLSDVRMRLILRAGDGEFPATAKILFSDNAALAFTAEDLAVAGELAVAALLSGG